MSIAGPQGPLEKDTLLENIPKIKHEIRSEMLAFLTRKNVTEKIATGIIDNNESMHQAGSSITLSDDEKERFKILTDLKKAIDRIHEELIEDNSPDAGLIDRYKNKLEQAIEPALEDKKLTKQYGGFKKLSITLLNIISTITIVPAVIKKAATSSFTYSTQGKSKEAVQKAKNITDNLAPKKKKPKPSQA